ncbi:MAG: hypothetical protein V1926_02640 [Candidatus Peregrinibacteria bacterium]
MTRRPTIEGYPTEYCVQAPDHAVVDMFVMLGQDGLHVRDERCRDLSWVVDAVADFVREHCSDAVGTLVRESLHELSLHEDRDVDIRTDDFSVLGSIRHVAYGEMVRTLLRATHPYRVPPGPAAEAVVPERTCAAA